MTRLAAIEHEGQARPYSPRCYYPFRICESGRTFPLIVDCSSLEEAVNGGMVQCFHKDHLLIREAGEGKDTLHLYAIKRKSQPRYVYKNHGYDRVHDLYAAPVCTIDAAMLNEIPHLERAGVGNGAGDIR